MKNYVSPELEIIVVNITDIIAVSSGDSSTDTDSTFGDIEFKTSDIF